MRRLIDTAAWVLTILFVMGLGAACHHQGEVLSRQKTKTEQARYTYVETALPEKTTDDTEATIEGYIVPYEMTDEDIAEEEYCDSLELLAACVEAEAGNQGLLGKRLVADVILNRVDDPGFPDTIEGVITQPYHFASYWNGMMSQVSISDETFMAVSMELEERSNTELLFFTAYAYGQYGTPWGRVGDHYFSTK
jgi:spore germination cell wall hydrolase CwlJ-like protein